jgi:hypothetical protein
LPESILDEDDEFTKYYAKAKQDNNKLLALTARGVDKLSGKLDNFRDETQKRNGILQVELARHCSTSVDRAHPKQCADGENCKESDVSEAAPKEGAIFFKGKVSGKWVERIILVVLTLIAGVGLTKFLGGV